MKAVDNYKAKLEIWARESKAHAVPRITNIPRFGVRRFSSYKELNDWKHDLLLQFASNGGAKWTK